MILSAETGPGARREALAHALAGCEECEAYLAEAGPELDALIAEAALRGADEPDVARLSTRENDALFEDISSQAPALRGGEVIAGPSRWNRRLAVGAPLAALAAAAAALLVLLPLGEEPTVGWTGTKGEVRAVAQLMLLRGFLDEQGNPRVGHDLPDDAEVTAGTVLLFRVATTCSGYPHLVVEREARAPERLEQLELQRLAAGTQTLQNRGMAVAFQTAGESGRVTLHLMIEPEPCDDCSAQSLLEAARSQHPPGECWSHHSLTVRVHPGLTE